jgi:hypothetical protein
MPGTSVLPGTSIPLIPSKCPGQLVKLSQWVNFAQLAVWTRNTRTIESQHGSMSYGDFSAVSDNLQRIPSGFGDRIARDRMGATSARAAEPHPRLRLGCRSLPKPHIPGPRLNNQLCIRPSTLAVRPILFEARGQQLFLCPQWSPALATVAVALDFGAAGQAERLRKPRWSRRAL